MTNLVGQQRAATGGEAAIAADLVLQLQHKGAVCEAEVVIKGAGLVTGLGRGFSENGPFDWVCLVRGLVRGWGWEGVAVGAGLAIYRTKYSRVPIMAEVYKNPEPELSHVIRYRKWGLSAPCF